MSKNHRRKKSSVQSKRYKKLISSAEQKLSAEQFASAADLLSEALSLQPEDAENWHRLGVTLYLIADMERASDAFARAVALDESNLTYANDLGGIYLTQSRYVEAEKIFLKVVERQPEFLEARYNLATCLLEQGRYQEAVPILDKVIAQAPELAEPKFNLGLALRKMGKPVQAVSWLEQALPNSVPSARLELARCYRDLRNVEKAKETYALVNQNLMDVSATAEFAEMIYLAGDPAQSIDYLKKAVHRFPKSPQRLELLLADIYINTGELEQAKEVLQHLVNDGSSELYFSAINRLTRMGLGKPLEQSFLNKLLDRLSLIGHENDEAIELNFTIAMLYDNLGNYADASKHYVDGNRCRKMQVSYAAAKQEELSGNIMGFFRQNEALSVDGGIARTPLQEHLQPAFIVGMPRAGTTLVEQILASHSRVHSAGELGFFPYTAAKLQEMFDLDKIYPYNLRDLSNDQLDELRHSYLSLLKRHNAKARFVIDKMPENFLHVGLIRILFPKAPIIHVRRQAVDVAISIFAQNFERGNNYAFSLEDIAHYYAHYEQLMAFWPSVEGTNLFHIDYEQLINEPEAKSRELMDIFQLPWEAAALEFYRNKTDVRTASNWQVRQPLYRSSIGRADNYPALKRSFAQALTMQKERLRNLPERTRVS